MSDEARSAIRAGAEAAKRILASADDGTLAGIELVWGNLPPPPKPKQKRKKP
jgi:hypothetical protein